MALGRRSVALKVGAPGFDDAPFASLDVSPVPKRVQFIYPYYENPYFLRRQIELWAMYTKALRDLVSVIVVDDGSPKAPAAGVLRELRHLPVSLRLFRIDVDVRWNWLAARNIGLHHANEGWCVLTDMDHVITENVATSLVGFEHDDQVIYRFSRREHTGMQIHPHPNSMFMTKGMFWRVGGYDEALSGHYGTDGDWRRRCAKAARVLTLNESLVRYEFDGDSSTTTYKRKQPEDAGKKAIIARRGKNWRPKTLSFPYHEVKL